MLPLMLIIYIVLGSTFAGIGMVVALTLGFTTLNPLLITAAVGAVVALPVSWVVAGKLNAGLRG